MDLLKNISWCPDNSVDTAKLILRDIESDDYDETHIKITDDLWNTSVLPKDHGNRFLIVPLERYYETRAIITFNNNPITLKEFLTKIYDFYHTPLTTIDQINNISDQDRKKEALNKLENGESVCYTDLVEGNCFHFEGIKKLDYDIYSINFGT